MAEKIVPIILCGGSGSRLWPLSTEYRPKPFIDLFGSKTLFSQTLARFSGPGFHAPIIVTNGKLVALVKQSLVEMGSPPSHILIEPSQKNTAAAILAASEYVARTWGDRLILTTPADHSVADPDAFCSAILGASDAALKGKIITVGVRPTRPETGYGYLELQMDRAGSKGTVVPLSSFVEKPDSDRAATMFKSGHHLWNAGLFLCKTSTLLDSFARIAPAFLPCMQTAFAHAHYQEGVTELGSEGWTTLPHISIDKAIMEKSDRLGVVHFDGAWTDVGTWHSVWQESVKNEDGNALSEKSLSIGCTNTILRSELPDMQIFGVGLRNIAVVVTGNTVLVTDLDESKRVQEAAALDKADGTATEPLPKRR